ncbi:MAG: 7-cyano-7-deazaguanine synthase QueC [Deltaproteobacteria bacterium]|nr:7-cyano-7-deazaguanine synthase QueC [Deltaproteobacteria bacterium]
MSTDKAKAVVLLSGGLDSTTVLAMAVQQGFSCCCLSFSYGQRQAIELARAREIAIRLGAAHHLVLNLDLHKIGGSALTADMAVPKNRTAEEMESSIPVTYVPGRNTIFLSHAVAWAEVLGVFDIFIGINAVDYSGYPDCRPEFLGAFEKVANLGTRAGVESGRGYKIHAPLMLLSKKEIILKGKALGVDYSLTHSCYDPDDEGRGCGRCDACQLRLKGFLEAGLVDPGTYR